MISDECMVTVDSTTIPYCVAMVSGHRRHHRPPISTQGDHRPIVKSSAGVAVRMLGGGHRSLDVSIRDSHGPIDSIDHHSTCRYRAVVGGSTAAATSSEHGPSHLQLVHLRRVGPIAVDLQKN
jgi:hypothetical protein